MLFSPSSLRRNTAVWLRQGISPRRLALTLALGFAIGCIPVLGVPTLICCVLALALRLNLPAIQAANYAMLPLQLLLIVPFARLGNWLFAGNHQHALVAGHLPQLTVLSLASSLGEFAIHALLAWLVIAGPAVALMTVAFTLVLRKIPALAAAEAAN